jgi:hypothetical protein
VEVPGREIVSVGVARPVIDVPGREIAILSEKGLKKFRASRIIEVEKKQTLSKETVPTVVTIS